MPLPVEPRKKIPLKKIVLIAFLVVIGLVVAGLAFVGYRFRSMMSPKVTLAPVPDDPGLPDIIVITLDTFRYDVLFDPVTGEAKDGALAPVIEKGRVFTNAYSTSSWTMPAHASMISGLYPNVHKADQEYWRIGEKFPVAAELLTARGYFTAGITENSMLHRLSGFPRGFYRYHEAFTQAAPRKKMTLALDRLDEVLGDSDLGDRPLFLFVNLIDAHWPYEPRREAYQPLDGIDYDEAIRIQKDYSIARWYLNKVDKSPERLALLRYLYDLEAADGLEKVNKMLAVLEQRRHRPKKIVILSDHGENFGEHGHRDHCFSLNEELVHVPMILVGDGVEPGRSDSPVSLVDLFPTILQWGKTAVPQNAGLSLNDPLPKERALFMSYGYPLQTLQAFSPKQRSNPLLEPFLSRLTGARKMVWKMVVRESGGVYLYDLAQDPGEMTNIVTDNRDAAVAMSKEIDKYKASESDAYRSEKPMIMDKAAKQSLKSLGYIQ